MNILDGLYKIAQDPKEHVIQLVQAYEQMTGHKATKQEVVELLKKHNISADISSAVLDYLGLE